MELPRYVLLRPCYKIDFALSLLQMFLLSGAGHGLAAILLMLISFPECYGNNPSVENDIKASIDYMLTYEQRNGNYPPVPDEQRDDWNELVHWCHGAPGVVYLLAKAFLVWKEEKYLLGALRCGELVWNRGLLKKGPGICHGIAGMYCNSVAYAFSVPEILMKNFDQIM